MGLQQHIPEQGTAQRLFSLREVGSSDSKRETPEMDDDIVCTHMKV